MWGFLLSPDNPGRAGCLSPTWFYPTQVAAQENDQAGMQYVRDLCAKRQRCRFIAQVCA